ncbi:Ribose-5-phosphate isomerase A [Methanimicrococcus sp. At1]|uniref:Ribose-5-phosphate isomerase A n=1 Tax=Methanimicrococcus hacksteinii TaxID=3028293 RepID=A0ABU3VP92_9EURY|nr:ribose-5-phosphate isomerase RpiA [Methanimicrococcus sp. At1]MDV0445216.1 Ribose-5-phosphate isomerase A [Methanimicrococcus sp. At1]
MTDRNQTKESPEKKAAGLYAASLVKDGDAVGLGTGSTVAYTIKELGRRVREENLNIVGVVTSYQSEMIAIEAGVPLTSLAETPKLDIAIDGADQFDSNLFAIKGGGAAHTREKIVSMSADRFVVVSDPGKKSEILTVAVPIEVMPFGRELVTKSLKDLGGEPVLRAAAKKDGPVITDNGNFVIDCTFGEIKTPQELAAKISQIPGVVEHGIFMNVDEVVIGKTDGTIEIIKL